MSRVMAVGLDGATWDIVRLLRERGSLPTLGRMMDEGAAATLRSTVPPITPTAWTSFFTGKGPGKHGVYGFRNLDPETYQWRSRRLDGHREKSLWHLLGESGCRSIVLDVPFTYPPRPLNGWMLTGYGTPRTPGTVFTFPPDLRNRLPPDLREEVRVAQPEHGFDRSLEFVEEWRSLMEGRERLLRHLLLRESWDFFMVVFSVTDNLAHVFWTYLEPAHPNYRHPAAPAFREALFWAYQRCDDLIGKMMEWAGPETTTLVMSDHGFGSVHPRQYLLQLLARRGDLKCRSIGGASLLGGGMLTWATRAYTRFPFLRERIKGLRPKRARALKAALKRGGLLPASGNIDYARSRILPTDFGLQMWVHERGRFAKGCVEPGDKEGLLEDLREDLLALRNPATGEAIFEAVHRGTSLYVGPWADRGPDLVLKHANFFRGASANGPANPYLEGGHTEDGIFLARGPAIRRSHPEAALTDLLPTILHLFGHPVPPDMDGRVLTEIFVPKYLESHPVRLGRRPARFEEGARRGPGHTAEQEAELEEQLRRLGYIS